MKLVPLKVQIGLTEQGRHRYPQFNDLPKALRGNMDWSHYVDKFGGWHYDHTCGHADHDAESPRGTWLGMLLVPEDFAREAVKRWSHRCSIMTEAEAKQFYEGRCTAHQPDIHEDAEVLSALAAKKQLGIVDPADVNALDPDHPAPGRRWNKLKTWDGYKKQRGIEIA